MKFKFYFQKNSKGRYLESKSVSAVTIFFIKIEYKKRLNINNDFKKLFLLVSVSKFILIDNTKQKRKSIWKRSPAYEYLAKINDNTSNIRNIWISRLSSALLVQTRYNMYKIRKTNKGKIPENRLGEYENEYASFLSIKYGSINCDISDK